MTSIDEALRDAAALGTTAGVALAAIQLRRQARQAQARFEDDLAREYRELTRRLPPEALIGAEPTKPPSTWTQEELAPFVQYIDLCNEQLFLGDPEQKRVSERTLRDWKEGMRHHFRLRYFASAWAYVYEATNQIEPPDGSDRSYERLAGFVPPRKPDAGSQTRATYRAGRQSSSPGSAS
jgi:hypothetical protein